MEKQVKTSKEIRQRKFLLVMPLLVLPFLTMIFWALGGGKIEKVEAQGAVKKGFNINLPDANLKDNKPMDKMSYYNKAQADSAKFLELVKNDPNYKNMALKNAKENLFEKEDTFPETARLNTSLYNRQGDKDPKTNEIYRKLAELDEEINKPVSTSVKNIGYDKSQFPSGNKSNNATVNSSDVDRLEQMMNTMNQPSSDDPEMNQLNGMLDKILDVQHPERVQEKLKKTSESNRGKVYAVTSQPDNNYITRLDTSEIVTNTTNGFYSLNDAKAEGDVQNAVRAVIHQSQTVVDGSTVELRLIDDVFINGVQIPKGNLIYGIASLNGERLNLKINSIRYQNSLFPVALSVYDMDGLNGIHIPGAITRDVVKQSADRSMQTIGLTSLDPTWQAQATGAGIEAAKSLFSKKVKLIKVTLKADYQVLLRDDKQMQNQFK
ncbi:MAG TPA: conjugative transposon protein TraM [Hanamia sp.]|nr:conjugative transposon protein TraM [Hanamia sp.]